MSKPQPSTRSAYKWYLEIPTRWIDNDLYGHVNNAVHYTWFDTVANNWLMEQGILRIGSGDPIGLVVASGCSYFSEISHPDVVTMGLRIGKLGGSSVRYEFGCFPGDAQTSAADGHFTHVFVDPDTHGPVQIPDEWRAKMAVITV